MRLLGIPWLLSPFFLLFLPLPRPAAGQSPVLLGDLNKSVAQYLSSNPAAFSYDPSALHLGHRFLVAGNRCYFRADDGIHGKELWASGGTAGTTGLVKDIAPGKKGSSPWDFCAFSGKIYFSAWTPSAGREIWVTDGTSQGTRMVADLLPGPKDGGFIYPVVMGKSLYFFAGAGAGLGPFALYRYDGGAQRPVLLKGGFGLPWTEPVPAGSYLLFRGVTTSSGAEPWVTDGTAKGTRLLRDFNQAQSGECSHPVAYGGKAWFCAMDASGWAIWETDGKKVFRAASLPFKGRTWENPLLLGKRVIFGASVNAYTRRDPFAFDTVTKKVIQLKTLATGAFSGFRTSIFWKGAVWFSAYTGGPQGGGAALWRTDGTPSGTVQAVPPSAFCRSFWLYPAAGGKYLYFSGFGGSLPTSGYYLWRTDGTAAGTVCLGCGSGGKAGYLPGDITPLGGRVLYAGSYGPIGRELFRSDGTPGGTGLLKEINPRLETYGSYPTSFTGFLGRTWFWAQSKGIYPGGRNLWLTDGTPAGTRQVYSGGFSSPSELFPCGFGIFFYGESGGRRGLWRSDGTQGGTVCFFEGGKNFPSPIERPVALGGKALFAWRTSREGLEPWVTDGTARGTSLLADTVPGMVSGKFQECVSLGRSAVFTAVKGFGQSTLWVTDGSPGGTRPILSSLVHAEDLLRLGDRVLFEGETARSFSGKEAWITDGTPAGTRLLVDLYPGTGGGGFHDAFRAGDTVYFLGTDGSLPAGKFGLFRTDGTAAGTSRVGKFTFEGILPILRPWGRRIRGLPLGGRRAVFWPLQGGVCKGPWVTDGTAAGTGLLKAFSRWSWRYSVYAWGGVGGRVTFSLPSGGCSSPGDCYWSTDGTPGGTIPLKAFSKAGWIGISPQAGFAGGLLYLVASDGLRGPEPWVFPLGASAERTGWSCGLAELLAGAPRLGGKADFRIFGMPSRSTGLFFLGLPGVLPLDLGMGQMVYWDPKAGLLGAWASGRGAGSLAVPPAASLAGVRVLLQGAVFPVSSPPLGTDFTNGILWTLGR